MKRITVVLCVVFSAVLFIFAVYGGDLFVSGEPESNGLNVVVSVHDGFTNRVEVYRCSDLTSNNWSIVTQNLRPTGDAPATWYTETTNDGGFFIVGNMDVDNDGDGLPAAREKYVHKTNPNAADSDADEMPDGWELQHLLNPLSDADATTDLDGDELNNLDEWKNVTNPTLSDTDGDGFIDPYDLHACLFDYPVAGKAIFNMAATGYFRDYLPAIGFSADGEQKLTLRWSDSFWYPEDYRNEGRIIEAGSSQLHWTGEQFPEQINLYKDNFWYDLGSRNWDPPLTHPMCYFYIHPPGVPNYEFLDGDFDRIHFSVPPSVLVQVGSY
jgi:hypothetical protein